VKSNNRTAGIWARVRFSHLIVAVFTLAGCASEPHTLPQGDAPAVTAETLKAEYRLGANDRVRVQVFGEDDLLTEADLDGDGSIAMKLIGRVTIDNMTAAQAEAEIAGRLAKGFVRDPKVAVDVLTYRPFFILGEVQKPGAFPFVRGMTIAKAAAIAGGFSYRAAIGDVTIVRDIKGQSYQLHATEESIVLPGDVIHVPERWF
jgi:protein involved in polysaccharide export with SLBB domain